MNRRLTPRLILAILATVLYGSPAQAQSDDTVLFTAAVTPNVLLVVDNSGSMNHIIWHEDFDPDVPSPTCSNWTDGATYTYNNDTTVTACGNTRTIFVDKALGGGIRTRYWGRYLNWYFSDAADDAYANQISKSSNGFPSPCSNDPSFDKYKRSRITTAKQALKDIICEVHEIHEVNFGIASFRVDSDPNGGYVRQEIEEYTSAQAADLIAEIQSIDAETWTPLGETLFQLYTYFMSRDPADIPYGQDGTTKFPAYAYKVSSSGTGGSYSTAGPPQVPVSPVEYSCQKNFIILITDGEPTKDDFDVSSPSDTAQGFSDFDDLIGDYNPDSEVEEPGGSDEPAYYLDDIAKFMHERDFRPDFEGDQTMDVYTVGFATTADADALLSKTAQVSDGLFFHTDNAEELTRALVNSISDIIEKSQSFTAATVPASRTTDGNNIFFSSFIPQGEPGFWEGHIKNYEFTLTGEVQDANGDCALDDPTGDCIFGTLLPTAPPFWDAADEVPAPASRTLGTAINGTVVPFDATNIDAADLDLIDDEGDGPADEIALYSLIGEGSQATTLEELADEIVDYFRGCDFGSSPCVPRDTLDPPEPILGDIFHSNPVIVSPPNAAITEPSYTAFAQKYQERTRYLYAGSNDGFLHAFNAGNWDGVSETYDRGTGVEEFGFMPWQVRKRIQNQPLDAAPREEYYVDGSPQGADVWFYSTSTDQTKETDEWHTILIGGLREGGSQYYALDITNPDGEAGGPSYPGYLWEFPAESAADPSNAELAYMAQTWSDPIITRVRIEVSGGLGVYGNGYERWVAIFGGGLSLEGEPNSIDYDPTSTAGRAVYVVDLKTGQVIAAKRFDPSATASGAEADMVYAFASNPGVFDLDRDGFADVAYFPDLGGRVWRWQLNDTDPSNWTFEKVLEVEPFAYREKPSDPWSYYYRNFFFPPTGVLKQGVLWLGIGSGERHNLKFWGVDADNDGVPDEVDGDNNRFYVFSDLYPRKTGVDAALPLGEADLSNVTADEGCDPISGRGYYVVARHGEKFVTTSIVFLGNIFTGSFIPVETTDPCVAGGEAWLWVFRFSCGQGAFPDEDDSRRKKIGTGVPTSPRISVGSSEESADDECTEMKVVVITSDGKVISDCAGKRPNSGVHLREWRED